MDPALWELYQDGDPQEELRVILRLSEGAEPPPNVRIIARFGDIVTGRVLREDVPQVWYDEHVESLKAPRQVWQPGCAEGVAEGRTDELDTSGDDDAAEASEVELDLAEDGAGVVVGFCDWGFDFTHPNFRNDDGSTRLLALWDQRQGERHYSRAEIDAALRTPNPCETLGYHPADGDASAVGAHGTHIADIAVGNRREPGSKVGLAPRADIVFVHLGNEKLRELENLGDSVDLLEGLDFVRRQAAGKPCLVSLSAGSIAGPHRGLSSVERAVDNMLKDGGMLLVQSVGNYADAATHTHARIGPNQTHPIDWLIPAGDRTPNELELWYSGHDRFRVTLTAPTGQRFVVPLGARQKLEIDSRTCGNFYHRALEPNSGLNHADIFLYPEAPSGSWRVELHGEQVVDGRVHAWIERDGSGRYQSRFPRQQATSLYTTNTICNSFLAIAVGAHDTTQPGRPAARFSSRGPTADGRQKPEVSAPGCRIRAARSLPRDGWHGQAKLCVKSGTSMAAPHVAGTVALMMSAAGRMLSIHEVRSILIGTADASGGPGGRSSTRIGYGYVNVRAAVEAARRLAAPLAGTSQALPTRDSSTPRGGWRPETWELDTSRSEFNEEELPPDSEVELEMDLLASPEHIARSRAEAHAG